jgi:uncharacterized membrane protein YbaN (DUF454 family)
VQIETFEQLINVGAGRQFPVSKAHQRKARNREAKSNIGSIMKKNDDRQCDDYPRKINETPNRLIRGVLIIAGTFFVGLGILGVFLPLLPTTPFFLLAAACYTRSSKRFYHWLLNNKWFGMYIKNYGEKKGIPLKVKILSISLLWLTIMFSTVLIGDNLFVRIILILIAIGVTIHISSIRTMKQHKEVTPDV